MLWGQLSLQDENSLNMLNMVLFYDYIMMIIMMIVFMIMYMLIFMFNNKFSNRFLLDVQMIEMLWTIIPIGMLMFLVIPSLKILYMTDDFDKPSFMIKIIGNQWYWIYEYENLFEYESFMNKEFKLNDFRLLDVDNRMLILKNLNIQLLITSNDVIHSFTVPSFGLKVDAIPGRINQISMNIDRIGIYYGQCSEICGVNHSFMPIVVEVTEESFFLNWLKFKLE